MAKKGLNFNSYSEESKLEVIQSYLNNEGGYVAIAQKYNIKSPTQVKNWVEKYQKNGEIVNNRGKSSDAKGIPNPLKRHRIHFKSIKEEWDYYKAQVKYLKSVIQICKRRCTSPQGPI